jgi:2,3-bisphosphoglycerate-independent phosphoglycerate mutase
MFKILVVVLDGVGYVNQNQNLSSCLLSGSHTLPADAFANGNAVNAAYTPNLAKLYAAPLFRTLKAHGTAVGLPSDDDMGNSEVGHNAIGAGRIFAQGATLVNDAIQSGKMFQSDTWKTVVQRPELIDGTHTLHLGGLLSDGNVHSHIDHLFALIAAAKKSKVKKVRLHMLLDGRDVPPYSSLTYIQTLDEFLKTLNDHEFDCRVASGGGRNIVTMDRYENDWKIVERGYDVILGEGRIFPSLHTAVESLRQEKYVDDQNLPAFVVGDANTPNGPLRDGDSFIFFNFRGDRAIEISKALTEEHFTHFQRKRFPKIFFAGMMQYDGDAKIPALFLVSPPQIDHSLSELLCEKKIVQFACSESQKFGHVTYFWNGNRTGKICEEYEHYIEVTSGAQNFEHTPWMKSAEIADVTIDAMRKNLFQIGRINFANGDMVGHTGNFAATIVGMAAVDLALGRLMQAAVETNTILIVTADHGNADEMYEIDKKTKKIVFDSHGNPKIKTSHTLTPVPFAIFNSEITGKIIKLNSDIKEAGLSNIAATILNLYGIEPPSYFDPSLITVA